MRKFLLFVLTLSKGICFTFAERCTFIFFISTLKDLLGDMCVVSLGRRLVTCACIVTKSTQQLLPLLISLPPRISRDDGCK